MNFNVHFGKREMTHNRATNFHSGEQEVTHDREMNFNVLSGKQDVRDVSSHSGEQDMTHDHMRSMRGLYVPMYVYVIYMRLTQGLREV